MAFFKPNLYVNSIYEINYSKLRQQGICGILLDLDNTLIPWDSHDFPEAAAELINQLKEMGFQLCLVSNGKGPRVSKAAAFLQIPYISRSLKPTGYGIRKALLLLGLSKQETAMLGDQIFTDILGANRAGLFSILTVPMKSNEFLGTKFNRQLEKIILRVLHLNPVTGKEKDYE